MAERKSKRLISGGDQKALKRFGNRVREIREKKKLSVYDVTGEDLGIKSRQHWQKIENGQKNINLTTIIKIALILEVDPMELFKP